LPAGQKKVFFSDLDGTLLDHNTYSFEAAKPALAALRERNVPLVLCSSKTRAEIEEYIALLSLSHPFISENGGAIFIPEKYFGKFSGGTRKGGYVVVELGTPAPELEKAVGELKESGVELLSFHEMSVQEAAEDTGLSIERAEKAKQREYGAVFRPAHREDAERARAFMEGRGLGMTAGGRYCHALKGNDKGLAVKELLGIYAQEFSPARIESFAFGDSANDFPMLRAAGRGFLVQRHDKSYASDEFEHAPGIGPVGWNKKVLEVLSQMTLFICVVLKCI